jgi:hypothetical protein
VLARLKETVTSRGVDRPVGRTPDSIRVARPGGFERHITGWVSRTARLRAPATQPMKGIA